MNDWDVSLITDFSSLFKLNEDFNEDIGQWDVGNGLNFNNMFEFARAFNQNIGNWNVGNGNKFDYMFSGAIVFNQDIGNWNVAKGENFVRMERQYVGFIEMNVGIYLTSLSLELSSKLSISNSLFGPLTFLAANYV